MEAFELLFQGFQVLMTWDKIALMMLGLVLGIFVGVLPGLGGPNGVAILLPLTFSMDPTSAIVMLSCIYWGALFGGAITSILFNITGEAWAAAATFACDDRARHKIVISMSLGLLLAGIGMDTVSGQLRMTFGSTELLRGVNFLVAVIGLFGISEILLTMEERLALQGHPAHMSLKVVWRVWMSLPRYWWTLLRSAVIGCWLGITPGGAIAASFMSYNLAKRPHKDKDP